MDQVNTHATFARDDVFRRARYADMCMKLIANHPADRGACTIAVDAPWGVGKSTFLWMWINELHMINDELLAKGKEAGTDKRPILSIYYNAWESDFCDNALAPLLYSICAMVDKKKDEGLLSPEDEGLIKKVVSGACGLLATIGVKLHGGNDLVAQAAGFTAEATASGIMSLLAARCRAGIDEPEPGSIGAAYDQQLKERAKFREALSQLAQKFGGVYIFIDELDRCKPSFAIDTLDVIKHYFDIPGLTFIFGVDMLQLGHAISGRYGFNYDAEGYLSKFFEHHIMLPTPTAEQMLAFCQPSVSMYSDTYKHLTEIFCACMVSPREVARIAKASNTLYTLLVKHVSYQAKETTQEFVYLLVSMQFRLTSVYNAYIDGKSNWNMQHWNEQHSFWDILSFFAPYMSMPAYNCSEKWHEIISSRGIANSHDETLTNYACIGRAILYESEFTETSTFRQCMMNFMEQVHI